jgi:hypothetical protein
MSGSFDRSKPKPAGWRDSAKPGERKSAAQAEWRKDKAAPPGKSKFLSRRVRFTILSSLLLVTTGALVALYFYLKPPKQAGLFLVSAGYEDNLAVPHNVFGRDGMRELTRLAEGGSERVLWWNAGHFGLAHSAPPVFASDRQWDEGLDKVKEESIILFLALHGAADSEGPYLLAQDVDLREGKRAGGYLRLDKVLDQLEKVPSKHKVLLILDPTQLRADWPLGVLRNDFVRKLRETLAERIKKQPNLLVLCSSDQDQISWASEQFGTTVFTHFIVEGLRGAADDEGDTNHRVTAWELYDYARKHVEAWSRGNRDALQKPVLFPEDDVGRERARAMELASVRGGTPRSKPEPPPPFKTDALQAAWQKFHELDEQVPAPVVYTPHLWRRYQDLLLRYDELLRAGDEGTAKGLKVQIDALGDTISEQRRLGDTTEQRRLMLECARNSLAMPAALGLLGAAPPAAELTRKGDDLWRARKDPQGQWAQSEKDVTDKVARVLLRERLSAQLLERVADSPQEKNLAWAVELLRVDSQRPTEAHFLCMLQQDLDKQRRPSVDLLKTALRRRMEAESVALGVPTVRAGGGPLREVHPYSEYVRPWIEALVAQGDESRRWGEDFLFGTRDPDWKKAEDSLQEARGDSTRGYEGARRAAQVVQMALETCQRALDVLPYYARWVARRHVGSDMADYQKLVENLLAETHILVRLLEEPDPERIEKPVPFKDGVTPPASLRKQAELVRKDFTTLEERFQEYCRGLAREHNVLPTRWRDLDDALTVPRIDVATRVSMLEQVQSIGRELQDKAGNEVPITEQHNRKLAADAALRQGQLALATLDPRWLEDESFKSKSAAKDRIQRFRDEGEKSADGLLQAGEEIGLRWRRMPEVVEKRTQDARRARPELAAADLLVAERLARQLDGAFVLADNPVQEARKLRAHELLLWLARRTYLDHWYDENNQPYYRAAANLYVEGAQSLVAGSSDLTSQQKEDRLEKVRPVRDYVNQKAALAAQLVRPQRPDFTGESAISLHFSVDRGGVPPGYPVAWLATSPALQVRDDAGRQVLDLNRDKEPAKELTFGLEYRGGGDTAKRVDRLQSTLELRFRGQRPQVKSPVNVYLRPDVVWTKPEPPPEAGIAVRADQDLYDRFSPSRGAIAIVLDCSGSMNPWWKDGKFFWPNAAQLQAFLEKRYDGYPCRFHQATTALREVLKDLPPGVQVSITIFSQAQAFQAGTIHPQEGLRKPEATITLLRKPSAWAPQDLNPLVDSLERLVPFNGTPLVRAMSFAKDNGFPKGHTGHKTLLVLTDGEDTCFNSVGTDGKPIRDDELIARHKTDIIGEFLKAEFAKGDIRVNLIAFQAGSEEENLRKQFEKPLEGLALKSKVYLSKDIEKLKEQLARGLKQKLVYTLVRERTASKDEDDEYTISSVREDDDWAVVRPGRKQVRVELDRVLQQDVNLKPGDFLLIKIRNDARGFERLAYGDDWRKLRPQYDEKGWALSLLQNQLRRPENRLDLMVAVESRRDQVRNERDTLEQLYPRQVWFDVKPAGGEAFDGTLRWTDLPGYPGPSLGLELTDWPQARVGADPAGARLTVYWNGDEDPRRAAEIPLPAGANYQGFEGQFATLAGGPTDKVVIESVRVEKFRFPGRGREEDCLIVRASHPHEKPVWLLPDSRLHVLAQEHRFYQEADKYTGIFVLEDAAGANDFLKRFYVYSVPAFKEAQNTLKHTLERMPSERERRPETVFQLRREASK